MIKKYFFNVLIAIIILLASSGIFFCIKFYKSFYSDSFRMTGKQVAESLINKQSSCKKISTCKLIPGDVLIRRYITNRTWIMNMLLKPYFTHSAIYIGDNQIVEAVGREKNTADEIKVSSFLNSDWMDEGIESWVIIRRRVLYKSFDLEKEELLKIAQDPDYRFGIPEIGYKRTTCADLIYKEIKNSNPYLRDTSHPKIITPDYLFWLFLQNLDTLSVVGYSFSN